ncbi:hypothetical protein BV20DRAFT_1113405 [Pilatotrama ljubarskyi]|nr:hypothetical protein BV20DRAFT_1113405 [Pilatotrama ljubarskyi]
MPRRTATSSSSDKRVTRSMSKVQPFIDVLNTAATGDLVPTGKEATENLQGQKPRCKVRLLIGEKPGSHPTTCRAEDQQAPCSERQAPCAERQPNDLEPTQIHADLNTGDAVTVCMQRRGRWHWTSGKVANLRRFRPRRTNSGTTYPVLLDQRRPRIIQWFDPTQGHILKASP